MTESHLGAMIPTSAGLEAGAMTAPDEITEDEIRSRAKAIILRNGWLEQKAPPQLHSIIELMVALGLDVVKNPPASCGYPGCGCDFDAVCNAALIPPSRAAEPLTIAFDEDDMPDRIWAGDFDENGFGHCVAGMQGGLYAEYVRADLTSGAQAVAPTGEVGRLTYGEKLIAEAIEAHFGERNEDYDEDVDDTSNHAAWEAFDAATARATDLRRALVEARAHINRYADTAVEHDLIARIDALTSGGDQ